MPDTCFHLIRHASTDALGTTLSGRTATSLNAQGEAEAERLARTLAGIPVDAILSQPATAHAANRARPRPGFWPRRAAKYRTGRGRFWRLDGPAFHRSRRMSRLDAVEYAPQPRTGTRHRDNASGPGTRRLSRAAPPHATPCRQLCPRKPCGCFEVVDRVGTRLAHRPHAAARDRACVTQPAHPYRSRDARWLCQYASLASKTFCWASMDFVTFRRRWKR